MISQVIKIMSSQCWLDKYLETGKTIMKIKYMLLSGERYFPLLADGVVLAPTRRG